MNTTIPLIVCTLILVAVIVFLPIMISHDREEDKKCKASGGVIISTRSGPWCIDKNVIIKEE